MLTAAIIIYVVMALLFGSLWPLSMFAKAGLIGRILVIAWAALLISGLNN